MNVLPYLLTSLALALAVSTLPIAQRNGMLSLFQSWHCSFASKNIPGINTDPAGAALWKIEQAIVVGGVVYSARGAIHCGTAAETRLR